MLNYTSSQLQTIINAQLFGRSDVLINSVLIDSRSVSVGEGSLFFAIVGSNHDGHQFVGDLYARGVRCFVVSKPSDFPEKFSDASFLLVNDVLSSLQELAAYHRQQFSYPVVGITGSNGKTIVKEWLSQFLSNEKRVVRSPKSYNSQVGVPLSVLQMGSEFNLAIFEAGISLPGEMEKLEFIISPEIGVFTNIGAAHQENFSDMLSKAEEKMKLFGKSKALIYCKDFHEIDRLAMLEKQEKGLKLFAWGRSKNSDIVLNQQKIVGNGTELNVLFDKSEVTFSIPFTDSASVENAMHCFAVLVFLGVEIERIVAKMATLLPVAMRLELKEGVNSCTVINDSYNSDLGSLSVALDFLARQKQHPRRMLILSDILQSGIEPQQLYADVAQILASKGVDEIVGIGETISKFGHLFQMRSSFYSSTSSFLREFSRSLVSNTSILIKGSREFQFERISRVLEQKTHRTVLEINLNAMVHNLNYFRSLLKPKVRTMVMVKAFAYGSGSHEIASMLQFHRVDYLGVAFADEGIALREAGITVPIIVLNPAYGSYELMVEHNLEPEIFNLTSLETFAAVAAKMGVSGYPIHLKIDTGMHRLGFEATEVDALVEKLTQHDSVHVKSIFSHLVGSDDTELDEFTNWQIEQFQEVYAKISEAIGYSPWKHILNSAGIERFANAQFDMVRLGIGLYGVSAVHKGRLQNVSMLKTFVAQLREVESGETVGYNRKGKVLIKSRIATVPIGYADGLNRRLSNGNGYFLVNGTPAPIIGNVSMDTCMVDVTNVENVSEGDEVVVFGEQPTIIELAEKLDTIPYEILTSISRRVKRVYIQE